MKKAPDVPFENLSRQMEIGELAPVKLRGGVIRKCGSRTTRFHDDDTNRHFICRNNDG